MTVTYAVYCTYMFLQGACLKASGSHCHCHSFGIYKHAASGILVRRLYIFANIKRDKNYQFQFPTLNDKRTSTFMVSNRSLDRY